MPLLADEKGRKALAFSEICLVPEPLSHQVRSRHHGPRSRKVGIRSQWWNLESSKGFTSTLSLAPACLLPQPQGKWPAGSCCVW